MADRRSKIAKIKSYKSYTFKPGSWQILMW